jgi:dCTP deaminase
VHNYHGEVLLSYNNLVHLFVSGFIEGMSEELINQTSIDVTLGNTILIESLSGTYNVVDLSQREPLKMLEVDITNGFVLKPGEFILAHTKQIFNLPRYISADFKLKSTLGRSGLNHMLSGWCDPGWHGSALTLELSNATKYHELFIKPGMRIGQVVFFHHNTVPAEHSYAARGHYNGDTKAQGAR